MNPIGMVFTACILFAALFIGAGLWMLLKVRPQLKRYRTVSAVGGVVYLGAGQLMLLLSLCLGNLMG